MTLKEARFAAGITQAQLAELMGVSISLIARIENGLANFSDANYKRAANMLGVEFDAVAPPGLPHGDARHGTMNGYHNYGCRCAACTKAWAAWHREKDYQNTYRDRALRGATQCRRYDCTRKPDRAYPTGYCSRCNIELGLRPDDGRKRAILSRDRR